MNAIINKTEFKIGITPVVLYGEKSDKLFIFVHGQGGEHWLHTKEQVEFMQSWETAQLKDF